MVPTEAELFSIDESWDSSRSSSALAELSAAEMELDDGLFFGDCDLCDIDDSVL